MTVLRPIKLPGIYKVVLWVGIIYFAWRVLASHSKAVMESTFLFLVAGQVPGTDVKLAPDTILTALPFAFALIVILIFHRELWRLLCFLVRVFRQKPAAMPRVISDAPASDDAAIETEVLAQSALVVPAMAAAVEKVPFVSARPASPKVTTMSKVYASRLILKLSGYYAQIKQYVQLHTKRASVYVHRQARRVLKDLIPYMDKGAYYLGFVLGWLEHHAVLAWRATVVYARLAWTVIRVESRNAARFTAYHLERFWRWALPHLWQFDAWLGARFDALLRHPYVRHGRHVLLDAKKDIVRFFKK